MRFISQLTFVLSCARRGALVFLISLSANSFAQSKSVYKSEIDSTFTIRSISLLPVFDNLRGIYSRPIEAHLIEKLKTNHRWDYTEAHFSGPIVTPDELAEDPVIIQNIAAGLTADAFVATSIIKGPSGVAIKMDVYLRNDAKLFAQEVRTGIQTFDVESLKNQTQDMFKKIIKKLPYDGLIMSRQGTRVTVNLGRLDGVTQDQILSVIQIIKANRHPKFNFLISTEKEIIGKIKLLKVDDTLSFGRILTEKEAGTIEVNSKIASIDEVTYPNATTLSDQAGSAEGLATLPEGQISFGSNPSAWLPRKKPTFGMAGAHIGIGQFKENVSASSSLDADAPYYPLAGLEGELWLTPVWSMHANLKQAIITTKNPVSGGAPDELSHSLSSYEFLFGYNVRLAAAVNAPRVEILAGFATHRLYVDNSQPAGLNTKTYSGPKFGVFGVYPLPNNSPYSLGAHLNFMLQTKLKESPTSSGSASNTVNSFGLFVDKMFSINLLARYTVEFEMFSSDFSGAGVSSSSQKHTYATAGLHYMF